jgi:hypothetical protein
VLIGVLLSQRSESLSDDGMGGTGLLPWLSSYFLTYSTEVISLQGDHFNCRGQLGLLKDGNEGEREREREGEREREREREREHK